MTPAKANPPLINPLPTITLEWRKELDQATSPDSWAAFWIAVLLGAIYTHRNKPGGLLLIL